jgi:integrase
MKPSYAATFVVGNKSRSLDNGTSVIWLRSLLRIRPRLDGKRLVSRSRKSATTKHSERYPPAERKRRTPFELLAAADTALTINNLASESASIVEDDSAPDASALSEQSHFITESASKQTIEQHPAARETAASVSALPAPLCCTCCGDIIRTATSSPSTETRIVPRRRFQKGRVFQRNKIKKWAGSFRDEVIDPLTGKLKRIRRTVTFDSSVTSRRAALRELQPYLDRVNVDPPSPKRGGKTVGELVEEWKKEIVPNRKPGGARASLSHLRAHIVPLLGKMPLRELNLRARQAFVTTMGQRVNSKKTVENVFGTLSSILTAGRRWGCFIHEVNRDDIEFPSNMNPKLQTFFLDADNAARVINAARYPFRLMFLIAALCYLRIGEVTALKISGLDFERRVIYIAASLDYATRKDGTTKNRKSTASVPMPELLERHLRYWLANHHAPNSEGYLFVNSKGRPYLSDFVRKQVHKAMAAAGIPRPKGARVGIHAFRHGASSELLDEGVPLSVVTRLMRHSDSKTTLDNYAHSLRNSERAASERLAKKIEQKLGQLESTPEMESTPVKTI